LTKRTLKEFEPSTTAVESDDAWTHKGISYERGDAIAISGERGQFKFWLVHENGDITVWWVNHCYRSFRPNRVKQIIKNPASLCPEHPKYKGVRKPSNECGRCWAGYEKKKETV